MDYLLSTMSPIVEPYELDAVTQELRAEFAKLDLDSASPDSSTGIWLDPAIDELHIAASSLECAINCCIERAFAALQALDHAYHTFGPSPFLNRQYKFWIDALAFFLTALVQLRALLARSLRATLRVPVFSDGPELSEYKHRLR